MAPEDRRRDGGGHIDRVVNPNTDPGMGGLPPVSNDDRRREAEAVTRAANDQDKAEAVNWAGVVSDFFNALLSKGLERTEALALTEGYQAERFEDKRGDDD